MKKINKNQNYASRETLKDLLVKTWEHINDNVVIHIVNNATRAQYLAGQKKDLKFRDVRLFSDCIVKDWRIDTTNLTHFIIYIDKQ